MRIAILSPHRDDAAFSCGLTMYALLRAGASVTVVNVYTESDYAVDLSTVDPRLPLVAAVSQARRLEDEAFVTDVTHAAGREPSSVQLADLSLRDAPLRLAVKTEQVLEQPVSEAEAAVEARELAGQLLALPSGSLAAFDLVFAPLAIGDHIDHRIAREAARLCVPAGQLCFYEDLPYAARTEPSERKPGYAHAVPSTPYSELRRHTVHVAGGPHLKHRFSLHYPSQIAAAVADEMATYAAQWSVADAGGERWWAEPEAGLLVTGLLQNSTAPCRVVREQE